MPFQQVFERRVNHNMQEGSEAGPAPREDNGHDDEDIKIKVSDHNEKPCDDEDMEVSEKKDRPPRFSTLFEHCPPPQIVERYIEQPPKKRSGITISTPLFIVLAFVLFFESTLLFAYTIIGLYNNLPHGVLPFGPSSSTSSVLGGCVCDGQQAGINISPNFIMPGANVEGLTLTGDLLPLSVSTSTQGHSSPTSSAEGNTLIASKLASFLRGQAETTSSTKTPNVAVSTKIVTSTPKQKTVLSTVEQTVIPGQSTSTSFVTVAPSSSAKEKRESPASPVASGDGGKSSKDSTPSTFVTAASPKTTDGAPSPTKDNGDSAKKATTTTTADGGACFGAGGAVFLNCVTSI